MKAKKYRALIFDLHDTLVHCVSGGNIESVRADEMVMVPCKNVYPMLRTVKKNNFLVGLLTRCSRNFAEYCIDSCHLGNFLDVTVCAHDYPEVETKPNPVSVTRTIERLNKIAETPLTVSECLFIGDTEIDYLCALSSGMDFVGFAYSDAQYENLRYLGVPQDRIVRDYLDLSDLIFEEK